MRRVIPVLVMLALAVLVPAAPGPKVAPAWPMLGGSPARNMASRTARGLPDEWDLATGKTVKGSPSSAAGRSPSPLWPVTKS